MLLCRAKTVVYGSESDDECMSPASPEPPARPPTEAPPAEGPPAEGSPGMNDTEMEVANELTALQRGVPSTTRLCMLGSAPFAKLPASQVRMFFYHEKVWPGDQSCVLATTA